MSWTVVEEQHFSMFKATEEEDGKLSRITPLRFNAENICAAENNY